MEPSGGTFNGELVGPRVGSDDGVTDAVIYSAFKFVIVRLPEGSIDGMIVDPVVGVADGLSDEMLDGMI